MKADTSKWFRISLGAFLVIYALNQFLHFFPTGYSEMPEDARNFIDGVAVYLPFLYIFEIVIGLLLIVNKWSSFILIVLFPLSVSFLIFTIANRDLTETWPALFVAVVNIILLLNNREKYKLLFD
jgi:putative oxidoreductase